MVTQRRPVAWKTVDAELSSKQEMQPFVLQDITASCHRWRSLNLGWVAAGPRSRYNADWFGAVHSRVSTERGAAGLRARKEFEEKSSVEPC